MSEFRMPQVRIENVSKRGPRSGGPVAAKWTKLYIDDVDVTNSLLGGIEVHAQPDHLLSATVTLAVTELKVDGAVLRVDDATRTILEAAGWTAPDSGGSETGSAA